MSDDVETGLPVEENEDEAGDVGASVPPAGGLLVDAVLEELEQAASRSPHTITAPQIHNLAERLIPSSSRALRACSRTGARSRNGLRRATSRGRDRLARWTP